MRKNTSGQTLRVIAINTTNGATLDDQASTITCKVSIDGGTATPLADTHPTYTEDGCYIFNLTKAETNGYSLDFYPECSIENVLVFPVNHDRQTIH
jgi:hypothetical protein